VDRALAPNVEGRIKSKIEKNGTCCFHRIRPSWLVGPGSV